MKHLGWLPHRAKARMMLLGKSNEQMAFDCGLTTGSLSNCLQHNNPAKPGRAALILMAHALCTTVDYLTGESDDPHLK